MTRLVARFRLQLQPTGVDRVALAYVQHFATDAYAVLSEGCFNAVLNQQASKELFDILLSQRSAGLPRLNWLVLKARWWRWTGAWMRYEHAVLINVNHTGLEHRHYGLPLRLMGARLLVMVHDLIPLRFPEYARPGDAHRHQKRIQHLLKFNAGVIANSIDTQNALERFVQSQGLSMPSTVVAPLGIERHVVAQNKPKLGDYFVMLGTIEPRKNHWMMLQIWRRLVETLGDQAPKLVIVGRRGWECENVVDLLERCATIREHVIEYPQCDDAELGALLKHSRALLFPTLVEGFGLPIAEALLLGVPVIASDLGVFREFAHEVPEYLDPLDTMAWLNAVDDYTQSAHPRREAQLVRMQTLVLPSWDAHFAKVDAFIADTLR